MDSSLISSSYSCPACDGTSIKKLGLLREIYGPIVLPTPGNLYKCDSCALLFRHPYISESELKKAYKEFSSAAWTYTGRRNDFDLAADVIQNSYPNGTILDIGCFRGDFLNLLPNTFLKYGTELSKSARKIARQHGIKIVGTSINHMEINRPMFHVITLLDVFEHLTNPMDSLKKVAKLLLPGGIIIISTGNTDSFLWRLMRLDYWYYSPEHVSFFNLRWFRWACIHLQLKITMTRKFSHIKDTDNRKWRQFSKGLFFWVWKNAGLHPPLQKLISSFYPFNRICRWPSPPGTHFWEDHILVVMKSKL
jgi:SAM-dependent methyltransferase